MVRVDFPGYFTEALPSGNTRHRVRVEGRKKVKITLPIGPDDPNFQQAYISARAGIKPDRTKARVAPTSGTVGWMVDAYISFLSRQVDIDQASPYTLKQRQPMGEKLKAYLSSSGNSAGRAFEELPMEIPHHELIAFRDSMMATPGAAHNTFKFLKAMYSWAVENRHCQANPAAGIKVAYKNAGGAKPWTIADLEKYRARHPKGTDAHLCLSLFMFSACRIGDAVRLGREHEEVRYGQNWLCWMPEKKGSKLVKIPILAPLQAALDARKVIGRTYLLKSDGTPFASPEGLRNRLRKWCESAGIFGKSSHGIRKAAGELLALRGATQYEIMAVHGHAQASTSQVYTDAVERSALAQKAAQRLAGMDW